MKLHQLVAVSFVVVLFIQLVSLSPKLILPLSNYGFISETSPIFSQNQSDSAALTDLASIYKLPNSLIFVGDVLLARNVESLMAKNGESYPYAGVNFSNIADNPYVIGNFESSIPLIHSPTKAFKMNFSVSEKYLPAAKSADFTHFSLANNHSLDFGKENLQNSYEKLNNVGFSVFGYPKEFSTTSISFINVENNTIALIGLHAVDRIPSESEINTTLNYAVNKSDIQIVYIHWGNEYELTSSKVQRNLAAQLVTAGTDIIIGHHPHVVQEVEMIDGALVFYSLGNYIFDQYFSTDVQQGLLLNIEFSNQIAINLIPVTSEFSLSQPTVMSNDSKQSFLNKLSKRSDPDLSEFITNGVLLLDRPFATSTKIAIMKR